MRAAAVLWFVVLLPAGADLPALARALRSRDAGEREDAVRALAAVPGRAVVRLLVGAASDEDPLVRRAAGRALLGRAAAEDLEEIEATGLRHASPAARKAALAALLARPWPRREEALDRAVTDPDPGVREAAVRHIVSILGGRGLTMLAAAVLRGREGRPRAAALEELAGLDAEEARRLAPRLFADPEFECRVAAVEVLGRGAPGEARPALREGLGDRCWSVRLAAMRALAARREPEGVPDLIRALSVEDGRLRAEAADALAAITGAGLPPDPRRWKEWWEREGARFAVPPEPGRAAEEEGGSVATFHDIPVRSQGAAFVLDRSKSMGDHLERDVPTTKARLTEEELERTFSRLSPPARFLLVAFAAEARAFTPRPVPATPAARRAALAWFAEQEPRGPTNLFGGLALALADEDVDTVFLLTDGAPSAGEHRSTAAILAEVADRNRWRRAVVHTVEIGREATGRRWEGLLARLAAATGGVHVRR